ncbi:MAG: isoprenylcysteine carboxylmethyltransferase family protein [Bacillati bacterium ANGP1]|uniref:Isoprenylcysteine carboxylmethyltransferase family protein n=1 Tax=Candidatus Segetimicrobium genomatis TaxID=2569760 RepID=A0A537KCN9_9BACT|nr:MAG: isoprenylcysteine carboxylmethyltransferase family protein [Gammaproteobacteria bacterium]TMI93548.1 MAG: isoprenylcysteine carboxylmethyltransferase family protein [Terrabacteria group bacterium ANGP1]
MLWRALLAFLALPGMVAFAVPLSLAWSESARRGAPLRPAGGLVVLAGASLLLWCVREFYVAGRGTLAPWAPPRKLVTSGPYRFSRNPMYIGVIVVLLGWAALLRSRTLLVYALAVEIAVHLRVLVSEEPWARRTFGADWEDYRARVPRWLPRLRKS